MTPAAQSQESDIGHCSNKESDEEIKQFSSFMFKILKLI